MCICMLYGIFDLLVPEIDFTLKDLACTCVNSPKQGKFPHHLGALAQSTIVGRLRGGGRHSALEPMWPWGGRMCGPESCPFRGLKTWCSHTVARVCRRRAPQSASTVPDRTGHPRGPSECVSTGDVEHLVFFIAWQGCT